MTAETPQRPPRPQNEEERLVALRSYDILDSDPQEAFDDLTTLASEIIGMPVSLVSLVESERQWFKSAHGIDATETPRDISFCAHAINQPNEVMVVEDARLDQRFAANPLVTGDLNVRFYAGAPLVDDCGHALGTLCVVDTKPRKLTQGQIKQLRLLARQVMSQMELHKAAAGLQARCTELEWLETIVNTTESAVSVVNDKNVIVYANQAFVNLTGFKRGDAMGQCPRERMCGEKTNIAILGEYCSQICRQEAASVEIETYRKNGTTFRSSAQATPIKDGNGKVTHYVCSERDITTAVESTKKLATSEARKRMVLDASLDAIVTMSPAGIITDWNRQAESIFGWTATEAIGRSLSKTIVPEELREAHEQGMKHFLSTGNGPVLGKTIVVDSIRKSGKQFPAELSIVPMREQDEVIEFCGFIRDISERVEKERQLRANDERLQRIAHNTPGMLFQAILPPEGDLHFPYMSIGVNAIYGVTPAEGVADASLIMDPVADGEKENLGECIGLSATTLEPFDWTGRITHRDGSLKHVHVRAKPSRMSDGGTLWDGLITDVTQQRQAQDDLEAARDQAEAASIAKSAFLANMSHEIRTPLSHVISFGDLIESNLRADLDGSTPPLPMAPADRLQAAATICSSGKHLLSVLDDVLDLSKIEAGRMTVEAMPVDPANLLEEVASLMRVKAIDKGIRLDAGYGSAIPASITADPTRLRQALMNLVGNALKFTERGGVLIQASVDDPAAPKRILWKVVDTGIGMTDAQQDNLFQAFNQADETTTRRFGGTGLGLAVSRRLVRLMDGDITCESEFKHGSTFIISLPLQPQEASNMVNHNTSVTPATSTSAPTGPLAGLKILVVEDGPENQWLIGMHLRNAGASVTPATDGREGVAKARDAQACDAPYDTVLMDMQMPIMDGYTAAGEVRKLGYDGPIIAFTAHAMTGDREKCLEAGCDDYKTKPINGPDLVATIRRLVDLQTTVREAA